nr:MAG TPA: lytic transglycosylase [Caudoviricetes sp.]
MYRKTGGGILGAIDKIKKPLGGILATAAIITMLGFAGHDDLEEAQSKSHVTHQVELKRELKQEPKQELKQEWKTLGEFKITAYCSCVRCCSIWAKNRPLDENGKEIVYTASGERAEAGKTIAVDTSVIPFGTEVRIGDTVYTAQDTGSAVKGNVIDIYFDSHEDAVKHGAKYLEVEVRNE